MQFLFDFTNFGLIFSSFVSLQLDGSTYSGSVKTSLGGVARNISDAILRLGQECLLITAVGNDPPGQLVRENNANGVRLSSKMRPLFSLSFASASPMRVVVPMTDAENDQFRS